MIDKISKKILDLLSDENDNEEQKEIMLFGITRIVEDIPKYIGIIIICLALGVIKEFCLVMIVTALYKTFTGGVHLHTNIGCFIGSLISMLLSIYLPNVLIKLENIIIPLYVYIYIFSIYIICVYVPADVPEIPVVNKQRRRRDKIMSFIILNFLFIASYLFVKDAIYVGIIMLTILNIDIMTTRTVYKIFKNKYGYETYIPDELLMTE